MTKLLESSISVRVFDVFRQTRTCRANMAKRAVTICQTDFPLYTVKVVGDCHLMVAGGGGRSRTGVANVIELYELKYENKSCRATKVNHYETGRKAIMNSTVFPDGSNYTLAAGLDNICQIYSLKYKKATPRKEGQVLEGVRKRKGNLTKSTEHDKASKVIMFDIEPVRSIETDFHPDGGFQKTVQVVKDNSLMVTAGADGYFRTWKYPTLEKLYEVKAHKDEIDELSISPDGSRIVTVSKDFHVYVWKTADGSKQCELEWPKKTTTKYRARSCRYGLVPDKKTYSLYTTHNPVGGQKSDECFITKWDITTYTASRIQPAGTDMLSAFAVSSNGTFLGIGTMSGDVAVHIAFSLKKLYYVKAAHSIFITGLEFAPMKGTCQAVTGDHEFTLFSISVDSQVKVHQQPERSLWNPLWAVAGFIMLIYLFFWELGGYIGL